MAPQKLSAYQKEHVKDFLEKFAKETSGIRREIASRLPAYNELLEMHANSFKEFALLRVALERKLNINSQSFSLDNVMPPCPRCGSEETRQVNDNGYLCTKCDFKFAANWKSISSNTNCSSELWLKFLHCLLNFYTVTQTRAYCGISKDTYYALRNRIFYAMQILMDRVKLYGCIQCDTTYTRLSLKGEDLSDTEYPEDSFFDTDKFIPREARERGAPNHQEDKAINSVCIFAAIDDHGHVMAKFLGLGPTTARRLQNALGEDKILKEVPNKDPFPFTVKRKSKKKEEPKPASPGSPSLLVSDKEAAIRKFAELYDIEHEAHVYREKNAQRQLPADAHHIQNVNNLHHKLKLFLRNTHYVSSKSLIGYLVLFEFIENTGATREAIQELFFILSTPGLGKPKTFFNDLYTVPNYLRQWFDEDNPLKKFSYDQLKAVYLYMQRKEKRERGEKDVMTVAQIASECGCSEKTVRRLYKNLSASGLLDTLKEYFPSGDQVFQIQKKAKRKAYDPISLAMYDECAANRALPDEKRLSWAEFTKAFNEKYGTTYSSTGVQSIVKNVAVEGLRPPLPEINRNSKHSNIMNWERTALKYRAEYEAIKMDYRRRGEKPDESIILSLAEKYGHTYTTMQNYISVSVSIKRKLEENTK